MRYTFYDGLRGFAALAVAIYHVTQYTGFGLFKGAGYAVDLFFCLSGFVLAKAYSEKLSDDMGALRFLLVRFVRLYPVYLIGFLLGVLAFLLKTRDGLAGFSALEALGSVGLNAIFLPVFSQNCVLLGSGEVCGALFPTNDPAWSLFFELVVGFVYACVLRTIGPVGIKYGCAVAAGFLILWIGLGGRGNPGWGADSFVGGFARVVYTFFAGAIIYSLPRANARFFGSFPVLFIALAPLCILQPRPLWLACSLLVAPLIVWLGASIPVHGRATRIFGLLGSMSYPLYCLHFPIYSLVDYFSELSPISESVLSLSLAIIISWVVYRFYESRARHFFESVFSIR